MPKVHTVIVHHRGEAMLARCLDSLLASSGVEVEIVVVANDCREDLPAIAGAAPEVHTVEAPRALGFSAANNLGVSWAREHLGEADYYYFLNNDTESTPGALRRLIAALEADPEATVAGPQLRILGAPEHLNSLGINLTEDGWGWDEGIGIHVDDYGPLPGQRPVVAVTGSALLADARVYLEVGGWTEVYDYYFEDIDLCLKVWERGYRVIHVPEARVLHEISATMTEGSERKDFFFWRNRLMLAIVHWPLPLLLRVFYRAVVTEILSNRWSDNEKQRRALRQALGRLPRLLGQRWRSPGRREWRRFLHPPGSVPIISLPEVNVTNGETRERERAAEEESELDRLRRENRSLVDQVHQLRSELGDIHRSKMWALWMFYLRTRRALLWPFRRSR